MRLVGLGDHQKSRGVLVEPMHDAGPLDAADARQAVAAMGDQGVDQSAGLMTRARMDDQPGGLVENDQQIILKHDVEQDDLAQRLRRRGVRHVQFDFLPHAQLGLGLRPGRAVKPHVSRLDEALDAGARKIFGDDFRPGAQELVESLADSGLVDLYVDL